MLFMVTVRFINHEITCINYFIWIHFPCRQMSVPPSTPRRKPSDSPTRPTATTTPSTSRLAASQIVQSSPHYTTTRRHSLYGTEDRVVIDPGSRIWKVGFSGEGRPRDVFYAGGKTGEPLWSLRQATDAAERAEDDRLLAIKLETCLRSVFHKYVFVQLV
jgi:actin-related protein 10